MIAVNGVRTRTLQIQSDAIPQHLGSPALEPVRLSGREGINSLFAYELLLKTPDALNLGASGAADFNLDDFIGREISCSIELEGAGEFMPGGIGPSTDRIGAGVREISALITDAQLWGEEGRHVQYKLTLRPWLHLATLSTDCKIFQNKTVVDILDELFADYPFPVDKRLIDAYPARDYQTQYNETDFQFFERLCQEWGINYFFEHSEGKHRLVLIDNMGAHRANPSEAYRQVDYHPPGWKVDAEYIHAFAPHNQLTSGRYTTRDYDYTRPKADLSQQADALESALRKVLGHPALLQKPPRRLFYSAAITGEAAGLLARCLARVDPQVGWLSTGTGFRLEQCLGGELGAASMNAALSLATIAVWESNEPALVVNLRDPEGAMVCALCPPDEAYRKTLHARPYVI
ncbi:hypothetical protein DBA29_09865 [Xenophilus aerolatus]|nr:hypothetical protein [Xenophilus aerolatus]